MPMNPTLATPINPVFTTPVILNDQQMKVKDSNHELFVRQVNLERSKQKCLRSFATRRSELAELARSRMREVIDPKRNDRC